MQFTNRLGRSVRQEIAIDWRVGHRLLVRARGGQQPIESRQLLRDAEGVSRHGFGFQRNALANANLDHRSMGRRGVAEMPQIPRIGWRLVGAGRPRHDVRDLPRSAMRPGSAAIPLAIARRCGPRALRDWRGIAMNRRVTFGPSPYSGRWPVATIVFPPR
jgi:hypothetical protein